MKMSKWAFIPEASSALPNDTMEQHRFRIQALLKQEPAIKVLIQGNTDERGTEEYNLALGDRRARVAKEYLASYGVNASQLKIISYGEEKPAKRGHDESAWAPNRRDEFNVTF